MSYFPDVTRWHLPAAALTQSLQEMALDGVSGNEGVVLWLGGRNDGEATVTHLVALRGPGVVKRPDVLIITPALFDDVTDLALELNVSLIGQIHSHGPYHGVGLSLTDRTRGISVPGYLSVVAPNYALTPTTTIQDCGVHVFVETAGFVQFSPREVWQRLDMSGSDAVPMLVIGNHAGG